MLEFMRRFVRSEAVMKDRQRAERFVSNLYRGVLGREPDQPGFEANVRALLTGTSYGDLLEEFVTSEEFRLRTSGVKLFVPPGDFYSPIGNPAQIDGYLSALEAAGTPSTVPGIALDRAEMVATWRALLPFLGSIPFTAEKSSGLRYAFVNPHYSWGDGSILHAMLRHLRPKRLIEIGSGWSSACTLDTVERYLDGNCELTFIDPHPELLHSLIDGMTTPVQIIGKPVQSLPLSIFDELQSGDVLFIDSTHILSTGSDVCFELFEILPRLVPGVVVHFHDMFWPFEYSREWAVDENRSWNELYAVRAFLTQNAGWRFLMFNDYMAKFERTLIEATYPDFFKNSGGALWIQRL